METLYEIGTNKEQLTSSSDFIFNISKKEPILYQLNFKNEDVETIIYTANHEQDIKNFFSDMVETVITTLRGSRLPNPNLDLLTKEKYITYYEQLSNDTIDMNEYVSRMANLVLNPVPNFYEGLKEIMLYYQSKYNKIKVNFV